MNAFDPHTKKGQSTSADLPTRMTVRPPATKISGDEDRQRFEEVVEGVVRKDIDKYIARGAFSTKDKDGQEIVVPVDSIRLPRFQLGNNSQHDPGGQGQIGEHSDQQGEGSQKGKNGGASDQQGKHALEVGIDPKRLAQIIREELGLPNRRKELSGNLKDGQIDAWNGVRLPGSRSLIIPSRTFRNAARRSMAQPDYDPQNPTIQVLPEDIRVRAPKITINRGSKAVAISLMDVSGSMGREQKDIARAHESTLQIIYDDQYDELDRVFVIHDAHASEVDYQTFFSRRESGGTKISSAYEEILPIIDRYPPQEWDIYITQYSDGDNWSQRDTEKCLRILRESILPAVRQFAYVQVKSGYGSGQFYKDLKRAEVDQEANCILHQCASQDEIPGIVRNILSE